MPAPHKTLPPTAAASQTPLALWGCAALIALAVLLAWGNSFAGPFILDDLPAIAENPSIRAWRTAFDPPNHGETVTGRPLVNLSFALNRALAARDPVTHNDGEKVLGYHVLNLAIHLGAALALFGLVRRTLAGSKTEKLRTGATWVAFTVALLWALHPLQTGAVTYIAQRAESLCALFYLLTLYGLARGAASARPWLWLALGVGACLAGMASKEVMVSAPLLAFLYDRTFVARSFGDALRRRWGFYVALAATWVLLAWLVWHAGNRGGSAGFGMTDTADAKVTSWIYLLTSCRAIVHYLWLCVWPHPLILDYGFAVVGGPAEVWWQGLVLLGLAGATAWALWRRPAWGFLGVWFFAILAPSSSVVPVVTEIMVEHRMYLPLAAVVVAAVGAAYARAGRRGLGVFLAVAVAFGAVTHQRNEVYQSALAVWTDNAARLPENYRVHNNLALALHDAGRTTEAIPEEETAVKLKPDYADAQLHLATFLEESDRFAEALPHFVEALKLKPNEGKFHNNYAYFFVRQGKLPEAAAEYALAVKLRPEFAPAHNDYANVLSSLGHPAEAIAQYEEAIRLKPYYPEAHFNLGNTLGQNGRLPEAIAHYTTAVQLKPNYPEAYMNLGVALYLAGHKAEALAPLETAVRLAPGNADARAKLETIRNELKR